MARQRESHPNKANFQETHIPGTQGTSHSLSKRNISSKPENELEVSDYAFEVCFLAFIFTCCFVASLRSCSKKIASCCSVSCSVGRDTTYVRDDILLTVKEQTTSQYVRHINLQPASYSYSIIFT